MIADQQCRFRTVSQSTMSQCIQASKLFMNLFVCISLKLWQVSFGFWISFLCRCRVDQKIQSSPLWMQELLHYLQLFQQQYMRQVAHQWVAKLGVCRSLDRKTLTYLTQPLEDLKGVWSKTIQQTWCYNLWGPRYHQQEWVRHERNVPAYM